MSVRPRITWVIPTMRVGGTERQLLLLMHGLSRQFDISVICTRSEGALIGDLRRADVSVRVLDYSSGWDFRMQKRLERLFSNHQPHILHTFMSGFDLFANRAAKKVGVPVILSSRRELATWQKKRHLWVQNRANRYVDGVVANCQAVADYALSKEELIPEHMHVIQNGIHADNFTCSTAKPDLKRHYRFPSDAYIVGMVANFSPVKDHDLFLDIADVLIKRRQDLYFLLVGGGSLVEQVRQKVKRRNLMPYFTRLSTVGEVPQLYKVMDVSVLCSRAEGFPNAILESMAAGTVPIAANVGGVGELIRDGDTGRLVNNRDPEAFASVVEELIDRPELRQAMGETGARWVREMFPVEKMVQQYSDLYHDMLRRKLNARK
jgi:glycosyltransferase involved in cell wall biosynthesis